ncbi:hypothetical protein BRC95_10310 [Halobacteriales archaeon QS_5_68_33]|nr:MAG: hypothetical protein BRC95_10310 [Halobacteriales archaeon QS_5_68_33]
MSELHVREYEPRDADALRGLHGRALRETENACPAAGGEYLVGEHATAVDHHEGGAATGVLRRMRVDPAPTRAGAMATRCSKRWSHALATRDIDRLVLHHREAAEKEMEVTEMVTHGYAREKLRVEMEKCVVLCASCHRKRHDRRPTVVTERRTESSTKRERLQRWSFEYRREHFEPPESYRDDPTPTGDEPA